MAVRKPIDAGLVAPPAPAKLFVGTSGWAYPTWRPGFYPNGLTPRRFLPYYASRLNSVEVNYTFRALPSAAAVEEWLASTPPGFRFSFKAPQRVTHFNRLRDCGEAVADLFKALEPVKRAGKLGFVLFQLPPDFKADLERLDSFLSLPALCGRGRIPVAFEFRHESWFQKAVYSRLRRSNAALCVAESDDLVTPEVLTAKTFVCFRLRRSGGYAPEEIAGFAERLVALAGARDVYAYLKHEDEPTGALNATALLTASCGVAGC